MTNTNVGDREPRWPAFVALFAIGILSYGLPESLNLGPGWLLPLLVTIFLIPTLLTHYQGQHDLSRKFGYLALTVVTALMSGSLVLLIAGLLVLEAGRRRSLSARSSWIARNRGLSIPANDSRQGPPASNV